MDEKELLLQEQVDIESKKIELTLSRKVDLSEDMIDQMLKKISSDSQLLS